MENKRRSFSTSKIIMSLHRATKSHSGKAPKPSAPSNSSPSSLEFKANQQIKAVGPPSSASAGSPMGFLIVNQDQVFPQQAPKVALVVAADRNCDSYGTLGNFYGGLAEDEGVDAKASKYISSVQERFRSGV